MYGYNVQYLLTRQSGKGFLVMTVSEPFIRKAAAHLCFELGREACDIHARPSQMFFHMSLLPEDLSRLTVFLSCVTTLWLRALLHDYIF